MNKVLRLDSEPTFHADNKDFNPGVAGFEGILEKSADGSVRLDAASGGQVFFERQTETISKKVLTALFEDLDSQKYIPVNTEGDMGTTSVTYYVWSKVGYAKFISEMANDIPRVDVFAQERKNPIKRIASSYGMNVFDIAKAIKAGVNIQSKKADASISANMQKADQVAWEGASAYGLQGLIDNQNTSRYIIPEGAGGGTKFSTKTAKECLVDLHGIVDAQEDLTFDKKKVNQILMAKDSFNYLNQTRLNDLSEMTILDTFKKDRPDINIVGLRRLNGSRRSSGEGIMIAYNRSSDTLEQRRPVNLKSFTENYKAFEKLTINVTILGGVVIYYPQAITQASGV